jgi:hypothetical protein
MDNIRIDLNEIVWKDVASVDLIQDRNQWRTLVTESIEGGEFID